MPPPPPWSSKSCAKCQFRAPASPPEMRLLRPPAMSCRLLRRSSTDAEDLLWSVLRGRPVEGATFPRQDAVGTSILDFFCRGHRLAIDVDGSRHLRSRGLEADAARTAFREAKNIRMLRFTNLHGRQELDRAPRVT